MDNLRMHYEVRMSDVLTVQVKTTSDLISTQLDKTTSSLGARIDTAFGSITDRIARLEQFRYETGGKQAGHTEIIAWFIAFISAITAIGALVYRTHV
jgi:hypothetical protein